MATMSFLSSKWAQVCVTVSEERPAVVPQDDQGNIRLAVGSAWSQLCGWSKVRGYEGL